MERAEFGVKGMTCDHCVMTVTKALKGVEGVKLAEVSLAEERAKVTFDPTKASLEQLKEAVNQAGYQAL
ncbi:Heavy metal transport/detoxification protein [Sulfobacillus acidophilus TPY]|uniref:Copper chaperone CopZ n=1 Tax=Sulfobacillus acidophilus (strain ATCC 700253 / DSM 10332 / NAL) TaxID=679936 RepID=G8TTX8_SULAD|nr:Heavy metal transport/detoxification protein [Sulfobacillus acidophilus TPY]AEW04569.1 copper ion binding protein [Sulfobacillus acidophilus DSM 10332]MCY0865736.1 heavy-metal-associated domain-containing protein [Sulfobacillus sp.]